VPVQSTFVARYLVWAVPGFSLLVAVGLAAARPRAVGLVVLALVVVLAIPGLVSWYRTPYKEDWRHATAQVMRHVEPHDAIVFYQPRGWQSFDYYVARMALPSPPPTRFRLPSGATALWYKVGDLANRYSRVWLILDAVDLRALPSEAKTVDRMLSTRYKLVEFRRFYRLEVRLYVRRPATEFPRHPPS
jgi:hypothetical protein